jgi:hypothetical protein
MNLPYPRLPKIRDRRIKISQKTKDDIVRLRNLDPKKWTYQKLADLYEISRQSAGRICDPEQKKRANETTKKCIMKRYREDPEFKKRENKRVGEYLKWREKNNPEYKKYHKQFVKRSNEMRKNTVKKNHEIMLYKK